MKIIPIAMFVSITISGCTNTVWVSEKQQSGDNFKYKQIGGIPFYIKKEVWDQSTIYTQTWLISTLIVEKKLIVNKAGNLSYFNIDKQSFTKQVAKHRLSDLYKIKEKILKAGELQDDEVNELVKEFSDIEPDLELNLIDPERVGNTVTSKWVVNEKEKYYLNAPLPWFGTGNLTQEISGDGTLSKVISSPDTKLAEGLSSLIPFKEYFTSKYVDPLSDDSDEEAAEKLSEIETLSKAFRTQRIRDIKPDTKIVYVVSLGIEDIGYKYIFAKTHEELSSDIKPLPFDLTNGTYTRSVLGSEKKADEKKKKGTTVGLTGSINFPEDWGKE